MTVLRHVLALALPLVVVACGSDSTSTGSGSTSTSSGSSPSGGGARVFFVEPQNGATVKSPVHLKFGAEMIQISPVPAGEVTSSRPGMGHHHVAVDADCLPPGEVIPKAAPWVHFGKGDNEMDMQLPPGQHKLTLELGDDEHRTQPGLCTTITVNVSE
jgi:hypothetical protein